MPDNIYIGPEGMLISDYTRCQEYTCYSHSPKELLQAHDVPQQPWERITMDYFWVKLCLLVCDYFSKFPFIFQTNFANISDHIIELFVAENTSNEIMNDNGTIQQQRI